MRTILLPTLEYPPDTGGIARYLDNLIRTFPDAFEVLHWKQKPPLWEMVRSCCRARTQGIRQIWTSHVFPIGTAAYLCHIRTNVSYVVLLHGQDFDLARRNGWRRVLARRMLSSAAHVIVNSKQLARDVRAFAPKTHPIVCYPSMSDAFVQHAQHLVHDYRAKTAFHLLTVGRLVERKGHLKVIRAIASLPNIHYTIVGDGPFYDRIAKAINEQHLTDRVRIFRSVADADSLRFYQDADVFVMPTTQAAQDREGFGIVYLEAQACGVPVLATRCGGVEEAMEDGKTGLPISDTTEALTEALVRLQADPQLRERMGMAGKSFAAQFTRTQQCEKLKEIIYG